MNPDHTVLLQTRNGSVLTPGVNPLTSNVTSLSIWAYSFHREGGRAGGREGGRGGKEGGREGGREGIRTKHLELLGITLA